MDEISTTRETPEQLLYLKTAGHRDCRPEKGQSPSVQESLTALCACLDGLDASCKGSRHYRTCRENASESDPDQISPPAVHYPETEQKDRIYSLLPEQVAIFDRTGRFVYVNRSAASLLGVGVDECIGRTWHEIGFCPEKERKFWKIFRSVILTGTAARGEMHIAQADGVHCKEYTLFPLPGPDGGVDSVLAAVHDITEQKEIETALRQSEERFYVFAAGSPVGIYLTDREGGCRFVNPSWCKTTGLTPEEARGDGWKAALHPDDRERVISSWECMVKSGDTWNLEYRIQRPDGAVKWVYGYSTAIPDPGGRIAGYAGIIIDITGRKQAETALLESEKMFRGIVRRSFDVILTLDWHGSFTYASPSAQRVLGYAPEEVIGTACSTHLSRSSIADLEENITALDNGKEVEGSRLNVRKRDGTYAMIEVNASPIIRGGAVTGIQCICRDISDRVVMEGLKQEAYARIEQNIEQFAIIGDHIRNPLQAIMGWAELIDDERGEKIREQVRRINSLIVQLDQGWIESRKIRDFVRRYE